MLLAMSGLLLMSCASTATWPPVDPLGYLPEEQASLVKMRYAEADVVRLTENSEISALAEMLMTKTRRTPSAVPLGTAPPWIVEVRSWGQQTMMVQAEFRRTTQFSNQASRTLHVFKRTWDGEWLEVSRLSLGQVGWIQ